MITFNAAVYNTLLYWMWERERIRVAKGVNDDQALWTSDPILKEWRFCNVNRCDDRETRWIFKSVIQAHDQSPVLWFNLAIARFVNWSPTLKALGYFETWDRTRFVNTIEVLEGKVFTGAYMIPAGPSGVPKHLFLADSVFGPLWDLRNTRPTDGSTCESWNTFFGQVRCMGDFLRNQIITDMKYSHHLTSAIDWTKFVVAGPGTKRGLNRLCGRSLTAPWETAEAADVLCRLRDQIIVHEPFWSTTLDDLNNLSNCLCELDKYLRVLHGEGRPRSKYLRNHEALPF